MFKSLLVFVLVFVFTGCGHDFGGIDASSANNSLSVKLQKQKEASDAEVAKLEKEIAKYEADKQKYSKDYETFNNNPILDELDETLKSQEETKPEVKPETEPETKDEK